MAYGFQLQQPPASTPSFPPPRNLMGNFPGGTPQAQPAAPNLQGMYSGANTLTPPKPPVEPPGNNSWQFDVGGGSGQSAALGSDLLPVGGNPANGAPSQGSWDFLLNALRPANPAAGTPVDATAASSPTGAPARTNNADREAMLAKIRATMGAAANGGYKSPGGMQ